MKKFIPVGIAAIGIVGFLGLGASAATAATSKPAIAHLTLQQQTCTAIAAQQATETITSSTAGTALSVAENNFSAAKSALSNDSMAFATAFDNYVTAVMDNNPVSGPTAALNDAATTLVHDLNSWSAAETAEHTAFNNSNAASVVTALLADESDAFSC